VTRKRKFHHLGGKEKISPRRAELGQAERGEERPIFPRGGRGGVGWAVRTILRRENRNIPFQYPSGGKKKKERLGASEKDALKI